MKRPDYEASYRSGRLVVDWLAYQLSKPQDESGDAELPYLFAVCLLAAAVVYLYA
jgi:hypothetical protein